MVGVASSSGLKEHTIEFKARDGFDLNVIHVSGRSTPTRGPVLLIHGAGVRANIFRSPGKNIVDALIDDGFDVWLENWRGSTDFEPNQWTLDQVAINDHPAAVETVLRETGASSLKAIIHCQGSTSFMMAAMAGLLREVSVVVSNAVSLHTVLPRLSRIKLQALVTLAASTYPYIDPRWGLEAPHWRAKLAVAWVRLTHRECDNMVCRFASFTYGIGFPTLWEHKNLSDETHEWIKSEFEEVPRSFFAQMNSSVKNGTLVPVENDSLIPMDFVEKFNPSDTRYSFIAGELNRCFLPEGQRQSFDLFDKLQPGKHSLHVLPDYAHLDIFIGKEAHRDVFPLILEELKKDD